MDRDIAGQPTADYLWNVKRIVPFLKVDKGLADEKDGVQIMKAMPGLPALLEKAKATHLRNENALLHQEGQQSSYTAHSRHSEHLQASIT